jgi:hypothetical protein
MDLLRSGSTKLCIAPEIQQSLRNMIVPHVSALDGGTSLADRRAAVDAITLSYQNTTLQQFEQAVSRATCETTVHVGSAERSDDFEVTYNVSPSAESGDSFVVSVNSGPARDFALQMANDTAAQAQTHRQQQEQIAQEQQEQARLLAVISPKWIVGRWIATDADPSNCGDDRALTFAANHVFSSQGHTGRWALDAGRIHFVGGGSAGNVDDTSTIMQADAISFTTANGDGGSTSWRRCARAEIEGSTVSAPPGADGNQQ